MLTKRKEMLHCYHYAIQTISTMLLKLVVTLKLTLAPILLTSTNIFHNLNLYNVQKLQNR